MALRKVTVKVPATSANLGPGFDCLGLALSVYATVTMERSPKTVVDIQGYGADFLSKGKDNLVHRSAVKLYQRLGRRTPSLRIRCRNPIPLNSGMGSSAAAVVGGMLAANALEGSPLPTQELLEMGTALEGHPDNVAPALLGGLQIVVNDDGTPLASQATIKRGLKGVLFIPDVAMPTKQARGLLKRSVARKDAVHNIGRASLLVSALAQGRWDLLAVATQDRLHQPQRTAMFPSMGRLIQAALDAGAVGACLSGAGPTVLAFVADEPRPVERAFTEAANRAEVPGFTMVVNIGAPGAKVVKAE